MSEQPQPQTSTDAAAPRQRSTTLAYVAFALSLLAPLLVVANPPLYSLPQGVSAAITWANILSVPAAFTLSIVSMSTSKGKNHKGRGFAIAALVISIVTVALFVLAVIALAAALGGMMSGGFGVLQQILGSH